METKHKYAVGQKVLFEDQIHTVADSYEKPEQGVLYDVQCDITGFIDMFVPESSLLSLIKESDGQVYGATKQKATRPRKKVFSTDKAGR